MTSVWKAGVATWGRRAGLVGLVAMGLGLWPHQAAQAQAPRVETLPSPEGTALPIDSPWTPATPPPSVLFYSPQVAIQRYLESLPGLPPNLVVVPATGSVPWPGYALADNIPSEVWSVVQASARNKPLMMFSVNLMTGEVVAMHLRPLPKGPAVVAPSPAP